MSICIYITQIIISYPTLQRNRLSTLPDGVGTYAPRLSTLPDDMLSRGRDFIRKWGLKKCARQTSTQQTLNAARRCRNVRDRPSTPLLSGFASEAAEGRRRSETHPTLQRNRLSTHPRGVRNVRTTVSTQHSLNAPQDNGVIAR